MGRIVQLARISFSHSGNTMQVLYLSPLACHILILSLAMSTSHILSSQDCCNLVFDSIQSRHNPRFHGTALQFSGLRPFSLPREARESMADAGALAASYHFAPGHFVVARVSLGSGGREIVDAC